LPGCRGTCSIQFYTVFDGANWKDESSASNGNAVFSHRLEENVELQRFSQKVTVDWLLRIAKQLCLSGLCSYFQLSAEALASARNWTAVRFGRLSGQRNLGWLWLALRFSLFDLDRACQVEAFVALESGSRASVTTSLRGNI